MSLDKLRQQLDAIDSEILELVARRQQLVEHIGSHKATEGRPLRDFAREHEVIRRGMANADKLGISNDIARDILERLIFHSLANQEQRQIVQGARGQGQTALVIGGLGRMGGWMARFLNAQGYVVEIADPGKADSVFPNLGNYQDSSLEHDVIVVAAPLRASNAILLDLARARPAGLVFDVASLKSPLKAGLKALQDSGCQVTSIHPMFGPDVRMLSGRHVLLVDVGNQAALDRARELFSHTMAECVDLSLKEHDQTMAWVLGLSHMLNVAFATTLSGLGETVPLLRRISSTTFNEQLRIASNVVSENPHLYFEIQHFNEEGSGPLEEFDRVIRELMQSVSDGDEQSFASRMKQANQVLNPDPT